MKRVLYSFTFLLAVLLGLSAAGSVAAQSTLIATPASVALSAQVGSVTPIIQAIEVTSSGDAMGSHLNFAATVAPGAPWLSITDGITGTTPSAITLYVDPTGLNSGSYSGQVVIASGSLVVTVPVTLTIGQLNAFPPSLTFTYASGGFVPAAQSVAISGLGSVVTFSAAASVASGPNWLQVAPTSGTTPATISVSLNSVVIAGLSVGTYQGDITLTPTSGDQTPLFVPVTLNVTATPQLTANPASLSFLYQIGGTNNVLQQSVALSSTGDPIAFGTPMVDQPWLVATPSGTVTPAVLTVGLQTASLTAPGTYSGTVSITVSGSAPLTIPVMVVVSNSPLLSFTPSSLSFMYVAGAAAPPAQSVTPTTTGAPVTYSLTAATSGGGNWLVVNGAGSTPTPFTVSIDPSVLPAISGTQTYSGTVTVTAVAAGNSPQQIPVTLTVTSSTQLQGSSTALTFLYETGMTVPAAQTVTVNSSTGDAVSYTVSVTTTDGGAWLSAAPTTGTTPGTFNVSVNINDLAVGTYTGNITVAGSATGVQVGTLVLPVTLIVSDHALLAVSPYALSFTLTSSEIGPAQTVSLNSTSAALNYTITSNTVSGGPWLVLSSQPGTTPGSFFVSAQPFGLASGTYTGSITITANNPDGDPVDDSPFVIPVTLVVTNGTLAVTPTALLFTQVVGGAVPADQTLSVTNSGMGILNFTAVATTTSGVNWLSVVPTAGSTPAALTVSADGSTLSLGTYTGMIRITSTGAAGSPQVVPVTLTVTSPPNITLTPTTLSYGFEIGGTAPPAQNVAVTSTGANFTFTAAASTGSNSGNWLSVTPSSGTTPGTLSVSVDPTSLAAGTYNGLITVTGTDTGNSPQMVSVTLTVSPTALPMLTLSASTLSYSFQKGDPTPAAQSVTLASSGADFMFTAVAATTDSGNWLSVTPTSGTTPATLSVSVDPTILAAGTYTGTVTITAAGAANSPQTVAVTLTVTPAPTPLVTTVQNAASQLLGSVAPGEIISIYGTSLGGPVGGAGGTVTDNMLSTTVADTQVLFDNIPAPLLYVSDIQINAVVPFELLGRFQTTMQVVHAGSMSGPLSQNVANTAPGLFTVAQNGSGPGAILNSDLTLNTTDNPAPQGSVIVLYGTGAGQTVPPGVTGRVTPNDGSELKMVSGVTAMIGGVAGTVQYAGTAPGFVEGGLQVNVQLPPSLPSGPQPVTISVGGVTSQMSVTVVIQ